MEESTRAPSESAPEVRAQLRSEGGSQERSMLNGPSLENPAIAAQRKGPVAAHAPSETRAVERLRGRLERATVDRTASARRVVLEASTELVRWLEERPVVWNGERAASDLEAGLAPLLHAHGWRGCVATWIDSLRCAFREAERREGHPLRDLLIEECGLWVWSAGNEAQASSFAGSTSSVLEQPWGGEPFAPGRRLASLLPQQEAALELLQRDSCLLVPSYSEGVLQALRAAREAGLDPEVLVGEGGADGSGKWLARELASAGCRVRLFYDAVLSDRLPWADRVWLGTESVGVDGFSARRGASRLVRLAREEGVPVDVFSSADDLIPGGELSLPHWCEDETWLLWEDPAQGVHLDSQLFEIVPADPRTTFLTESGQEDFAALHLRALRTRAQSPLIGSLED